MPTCSLFMVSRLWKLSRTTRGRKRSNQRTSHSPTLYRTILRIRTPKYTFTHPSGPLFATQFRSDSFGVTEKAAFEDLWMKGFVQKDCAFPGHSLGEYSALASDADVLPVSR
jgi:malonyl CoA-acyl carrier protein transacylase